MIPSIGRIVHYVLPNGEHRPAMIVNILTDTREVAVSEKRSVNLQVFIDGSNDSSAIWPDSPAAGLIWRTGVDQDAAEKKAGTWHEPERA